MSEHRKRDKTLTIRLTEKEREQILHCAAKARMSLTDYILTSALTAEIHVVEDMQALVLCSLMEFHRNKKVKARA